MNIFSILLVVLFGLNMVFAAIIIFIERKDATATWAWLMILFFIPFLGFLVYLFLGQNLTRSRLFDWEGIKKVGIEDLISKQMNQIRDPKFKFDNDIVEEHRDMIFMHLLKNDAVLMEDNNIDLFFDGKDKFKQLLSDIAEAKNHIHIQYYIFQKTV